MERKTATSQFTHYEELAELMKHIFRLVCPYSGEPLDENNPPFMLPNGRVYGERSIEKLCKDNQIECPRTREIFPLNQVVRVFVL